MNSPDTAAQIVESLSTAVLVFDDSLAVAQMNPAAEMLLATSVRKARGKPLSKILPSDGEFAAGIAEALRTGQSFTEREMTLHLPGKAPITVDCTVTPLRDRGARLAAMVELQRVDRHLRISREESLLAQSHATRALVRGMAHEIKNPLGGLRGAAQLLEHELGDEELREYTRIIIAEADRLQNLVNKLLGPNTPPQTQDINVHEVMERVYALVSVEAPAGVKLERDYDPSIPNITADPETLIQAILNIVRNAVQAVGDGGRVRLRTRVERHFTIGHRCHRLVLRIDIQDNGPGIPEDMLQSIFYPMVTGRAEGTGLGLSIAQELINRHGGLIACDSEPGNTVFMILLPLESENRDAA